MSQQLAKQERASRAKENEYSEIRDSSSLRRQDCDQSLQNTSAISNEYETIKSPTKTVVENKSASDDKKNDLPVYSKPIPKSQRPNKKSDTFSVVFPNIDLNNVTSSLPQGILRQTNKCNGPTYCNLVSRKSKSIRKVSQKRDM